MLADLVIYKSELDAFDFSAFHDVSVYPKKELPFFILFTAGLCSFTALLALLTHQYPEPMGIIAKTVSIDSIKCLYYDKRELMLEIVYFLIFSCTIVQELLSL